MPRKPWRWTPKRKAVVADLSLGYTRKEAAKRNGVGERTIYTWQKSSEFMEELYRQSLMNGIACKAERLRIAQRAVRQLVNEAGVKTSADVLAWLKYAQSETDGITLDLAPLLGQILDVAGGGQARTGENSASDTGAEVAG